MCRINSIKPPCGYVVEGIAQIWLLDFADFQGFQFDGLYDSAVVTGILKTGNFVELDAPGMTAKYSSAGAYVHTLETFVGGLSASSISNLHLATKRRQVVAFKTNAGAYYVFGYEAGAVVNYKNQTVDGAGSLVTINAPSIYPLFVTDASILADV